MLKRFLLCMVFASFVITTSTTSAVLSQTEQAAPETPEATAETTQEAADVEVLLPRVLSTIPHSTDDFTQGLVWHDGRLFQSTGQYGGSHLQELDPETGDVIREIALPDEYFGEGLALVDDSLIQITWQEHTALIYDLESFEQTGTFEYDTEGWGLCYDGEHLYMSDGSAMLFERDPETFEITREIAVTLLGEPVPQLNELECVDEVVYANVWYTDAIVRIDKETGVITGVVDARALLTQQERSQLSNGAVLNGIAYNPDEDVFYITGKLWPQMYEVRFTPVQR